MWSQWKESLKAQAEGAGIDVAKFQKVVSDVGQMAESAKEVAKKNAEIASKKAKAAAAAVQQEYHATFEEQLTQIVDIIPRKLLVMEYPTPDKLERLANRLNRNYGNAYLVLNMSEHGYRS